MKPTSTVVGSKRGQHAQLALLAGSWVVISRLKSPLIRVIIIVALLITPLITTHKPPSEEADGLDTSKLACLDFEPLALRLKAPTPYTLNSKL